MVFERRTAQEIFAEIETQVPAGDLGCLMLIAQAFYQTGQDLVRNAEVIAAALQKGSYKFKGKEYSVSIEQFKNFSPKKYGLQLANIMIIGHKEGKKNPRGLLFLKDDETMDAAVNMSLSAQEGALKEYQRLLQEGTHGKRDAHSDE